MFHRSRPFYPEMALDALARITRVEAEILDPVAAALAGRDGDEAEEIVRIGMRLEDGEPECLDALVQAMGRRSFEDFAESCLLD